MAVDRERVKARFKEKFKTVTLSNQRIDEISDRLAPQLADDAEDAAIDSQLDFINGLHPQGSFLVMQKADDAEANEKFNKQKSKTQNTNPDSSNQQQNTPPPKSDDPLLAALQELKALREDMQSLKKEKVQTTIEQQIAAELTDVPKNYWSLAALPDSPDLVPAFVDKVKTSFTALQQELAGSSFGNGKVARGTQSTSKEASQAEIDAAWSEIKPS